MDAAGWTPRVPLVAAERRVDFPGINSHIRTRRAAVEAAAAPAARRLAYIVAEHSLPTTQVEADLEEKLYVALTQTIEFGYRSVRRELGAPRPSVRAALSYSGVGDRGRSVLQGLPGVHNVVRSRASLVAHNVAGAARSAAHTAAVAPGSTPVTVRSATAAQVRRALHNGVLQVVSEALNLGRAVAAQEVLAERGGGTVPVTAAAGDGPPEFCMRSEQLDENTCNECDQIHGSIYQVGSEAYYDDMPPAYCEGDGRCRGLYIYGEGSEFSAETPMPREGGAPEAPVPSTGEPLPTGLSPEEAFRQLQERYPGIGEKTYLNYCDQATTLSKAGTEKAVGFYDIFSRQIFLNDRWFSTIERRRTLESQLAKDSSSGFRPAAASDPGIGVVGHEFGHAIDDWIEGIASEDESVWQVYQQFKYVLADVEKLGGYGATNFREAFAELFVRYLGDPALLSAEERRLVGEMHRFLEHFHADL